MWQQLSTLALDIQQIINGGQPPSDDFAPGIRQVKYWLLTTAAEIIQEEVSRAKAERRPIDPRYYASATLTLSTPTAQSGYVRHAATLPLYVLDKEGDPVAEVMVGQHVARYADHANSAALSRGYGRWGNPEMVYSVKSNQLLLYNSKDPHCKTVFVRYLPAVDIGSVGQEDALVPVTSDRIPELRRRVLQLAGISVQSPADQINNGAQLQSDKR